MGTTLTHRTPSRRAIAMLALFGLSLAALLRRFRKKSAWYFGGPSWERSQDFVGACRMMGITQISVAVDNQTDPAKWSEYSPAQFADFHRRMRAAGIEVVLGFWPKPDRAWVEGYVSGLGGILDVARREGVRGIELDVEGGNWNRWPLRGYASRSEAAADISRRIKSAGIRLEVTTHSGHVNDPEYRVFLEQADFISLQMYSKYNPEDDPDRVWGARNGPGNMQRRVIDALKARFPRAKVVAGLAAWEQEYPEGKERAMREAYAASVQRGARNMRWFDMRHLLRDPEAMDIVRRL